MGVDGEEATGTVGSSDWEDDESPSSALKPIRLVSGSGEPEPLVKAVTVGCEVEAVRRANNEPP